MTPEQIERIEKLIEAYENLPIRMGVKAQQKACEFINQNHSGFRDIKALLDGYREMREALNDILYTCKKQRKALSKEGITSGHRVFEITAIEEIAKQALGGK